MLLSEFALRLFVVKLSFAFGLRFSVISVHTYLHIFCVEFQIAFGNLAQVCIA